MSADVEHERLKMSYHQWAMYLYCVCVSADMGGEHSEMSRH